MALVKFEHGAIPITDEDGTIRYAPGVRLGKGDFNLISNQGRIVTYENRKEALEYFED